MEHDNGVKDFLLHYPDLVTTASILTDLARINPNLFNDIIMLAMVIAIHSEIKYKVNADKMEKLRELSSKMQNHPMW